MADRKIENHPAKTGAEADAMAFLVEMAEVINSTFELDALLQRVADHLKERIDYDNFGILLLQGIQIPGDNDRFAGLEALKPASGVMRFNGHCYRPLFTVCLPELTTDGRRQTTNTSLYEQVARGRVICQL